jgi:hypothetical protein
MVFSGAGDSSQTLPVLTISQDAVGNTSVVYCDKFFTFVDTNFTRC